MCHPGEGLGLSQSLSLTSRVGDGRIIEIGPINLTLEFQWATASRLDLPACRSEAPRTTCGDAEGRSELSVAVCGGEKRTGAEQTSSIKNCRDESTDVRLVGAFVEIVL